MQADPSTRSAPAPAPAPRLRDAAVVLPLLGLFAWMPPVSGLFARTGHALGIPLIVAWLFGIWFVLIVVAFWFSRHLDSEEDAERVDEIAPTDRAEPADSAAR